MAVGGQPVPLMTLQSLQETDAVVSNAECMDYFQQDSNFQELMKQSQPNIQMVLKYLFSINNGQFKPSRVPTPEFYDAAIVFAALDKKQATEVMNFMNNLTLEKDVHPKVCLFDKAEFGGSEIRLPETLIDRCSLIFPLLTDNFEHDKDVQFLNEETVAGTRLCDGKLWQQYCVRPLHTKPKKGRNYPIPFGLASIRSYDVFNLNDEHTISKFNDLFEHNLSFRKNRERESKKSRKGTPNINTDQPQSNSQDTEEGQTMNLHNPDNLDGRQSLPDEKATQIYSGGPAVAARRDGFEGAVGSRNTLIGSSPQRETEDPTNVPGTQMLSEIGLLNDYVTMRKINVGEATAGKDISVDLKQTRPKVTLHGLGSLRSEVLKGRQDKQVCDQQTTPVLTPGPRPACLHELNRSNTDDPKSVDPALSTLTTDHTKSSKEDQEQERYSSMETEFGGKSLSEETRNDITEGMLPAAPALREDSDEDVEEDDQSCTKVPCVGSELHELTGEGSVSLPAKTDKNGNSEGRKEFINGEADQVSDNPAPEIPEDDPDQTPIQSLSSQGECCSDPVQNEMSLYQDSSLDVQESIIEEASPDEPISDSTNNDIEITKSDKVGQYISNDLNDSITKLTLGLDYIEKNSDETITEAVLKVCEPAYSKNPGLCSSPESEYKQFTKALPPKDETSAKTSNNGHQNNEEKEESKSPPTSDTGVPEHERRTPQNPDNPAGTQLPVENVGTTFVYIYNSSNIRIEGENNIHMKADTTESEREQNTNMNRQKKNKGVDPGWRPPHRQKEKKNDDKKSASHSNSQDWSNSSPSSMKSPALKMITQGDVPPECTSRSSSFTDLPQTSSSVESSLDAASTTKPVCDKHKTDNGGAMVKESRDHPKSLKNVTGSKTSGPILTNDSTPVIETVQSPEKDGEEKRKKKQGKQGCFAFFWLMRKKKKKGRIVNMQECT